MNVDVDIFKTKEKPAQFHIPILTFITTIPRCLNRNLS